MKITKLTVMMMGLMLTFLGSGLSTSTGTVSSMGNNMIVNNDIDVAGTQNFVTFLPGNHYLADAEPAGIRGERRVSRTGNNID